MDSSLNNSQSKEISVLPLTTIRRIMKSSPDMDFIAADAIMSTTRATEMFINYITTKSYEKTKNAKELDYNHVANYVAQDDKLEFLVHIIPHKMTVKKARELINKPESSDSESDDEDDDDEEQEDEESEDESDESDADDDETPKIDLTISDDD